MNSLFVKGNFVAFKQGMREHHHSTSLIKINNVESAQEAKYYVNKRVAMVIPKSQKVVYGTITRIHGNNGIVQAKFTSNLCPQFIGSQVRVMLYPQSE
ncbi:Ribosomal_protein L35 [Hexamita inflata]|uniref:Ribosomal protein L35 n=1 Tax=Hexamita inflata TaxID=28002 RepID=A0AA86RQF1_9EUKA|nr:Ribosomal protein L35 [Hexamita inflata]CAI9969468.1 Ribosomal protein L35 [Hexamita inflata]CAI9976129.1 Ribosomal protein L35 [Hexamita inflata]